MPPPHRGESPAPDPACPPDLPERFPFWDWSLATYARAGVAQACLGLQDRRGVDVNLLLFALWLAVENRPLGDAAASPAAAATTLGRLASDASRWHAAMVQPLRSGRRAARNAGAALPPAALERFRDRIKALELEAERHEQWLLYRAVVTLPRSGVSLPCDGDTGDRGETGAEGDVREMGGAEDPVRRLARRHLEAVASLAGIAWGGDDLAAIATLIDASLGMSRADRLPDPPQKRTETNP